jgi:hypothetical protein
MANNFKQGCNSHTVSESIEIDDLVSRFWYDAELNPVQQELIMTEKEKFVSHIIPPGGSCSTMSGMYCGKGTENESLIHFNPVTSTLEVCISTK